MSDARHNQALIDELCAARECSGPSWWDCHGTAGRGCYEQAKSNYAGGIDRQQTYDENNRTVRRGIYGPENSPKRD